MSYRISDILMNIPLFPIEENLERVLALRTKSINFSSLVASVDNAMWGGDVSELDKMIGRVSGMSVSDPFTSHHQSPFTE